MKSIRNRAEKLLKQRFKVRSFDCKRSKEKQPDDVRKIDVHTVNFSSHQLPFDLVHEKITAYYCKGWELNMEDIMTDKSSKYSALQKIPKRKHCDRMQ